jgi:radical SAM protein with 4Fe4S-binding SPASM domain
MSGRSFSLVLLSTLQCNAACDYCFETRAPDRLTLERLTVLITRVLDYLDDQAADTLTIYWQGGEALLLPPDWYEQAYHLIQQAATARQKTIHHCLQSNLLAYTPRWQPLIATMFGNSIGTSVDYPNPHRKLPGRGSDAYDRLWARKLRQARAAGIEITAIAVPNQGTLALGAERFYRYFVETLELHDFQVNTPFPGGPPHTPRPPPLDVDPLTRFYLDLADLWCERGAADGVRIGPFSELLDRFRQRPTQLPCIWHENCADTLIAIDPLGRIAQCDCWVTSYPEYHFGNIFENDSLAEQLRTSPARQHFTERPIALVQRDCLECAYLSLCHGGCPIRTYTVRGTLSEKDPYCRLYQALFQRLEQAAARLAGNAVSHTAGSNL